MKMQQDIERDGVRDLDKPPDHEPAQDDIYDRDNHSNSADRQPLVLGLMIDDVSNLELYLREVRDIPLLTRDQEVNLAKQMERGRKAGAELEGVDPLDTERRDALIELIEVGEQARRKLIEANSRLVISLAKKYSGQGLSLLDLIQEGYLGLMRAVDKFDYRRGNKLSTYATWWIKHTMSRAVAEHGGTIRLPAHVGDRIRHIATVSTQLSQTLGRDPSQEELASEMGLDPEQIRLILRAQKRPLSFEEMLWDDEGGDSPYDAVEDEDTVSPTEALARLDLNEALDKAFSALTPREERVLVMRFGLRGGYPHKLHEVGKKFGLTRERIRQIERNALEKLRQPHRRKLLEEFAA